MMKFPRRNPLQLVEVAQSTSPNTRALNAKPHTTRAAS
jgi:hypothetical protein